MGSKRLDNLFDCVQHGFNVRARCRVCGADRVLAAKPLSRRFLMNAWPSDFASVGSRLRCKVCGERPCEASPTMDEPSNAWRPIESAPKDRSILVGHIHNQEWQITRVQHHLQGTQACWATPWTRNVIIFHSFTHWHEDVAEPPRSAARKG